MNTKGVRHAALIGTDIVGQKTKDGVGIGTPIARLRARYAVACHLSEPPPVVTVHFYTDPGERLVVYCYLGPKSAPTTIFGLWCTNFVSRRTPPCTEWAVSRMIVREGVLRFE